MMKALIVLWGWQQRQRRAGCSRPARNAALRGRRSQPWSPSGALALAVPPAGSLRERDRHARPREQPAAHACWSQPAQRHRCLGGVASDGETPSAGGRRLQIPTDDLGGAASRGRTPSTAHLQSLAGLVADPPSGSTVRGSARIASRQLERPAGSLLSPASGLHGAGRRLQISSGSLGGPASEDHTPSASFRAEASGATGWRSRQPRGQPLMRAAACACCP